MGPRMNPPRVKYAWGAEPLQHRNGGVVRWVGGPDNLDAEIELT